MNPETLPDADRESARQIARLTTDFVLRAVDSVAALHGGDFVRALVASTIVSANTSHFAGRNGQADRYGALDDLAPDEARRPVSVMAVANALGLPFETTRRCVNRLIADGMVKRVKGGVIGLASAIATPENEAVITANLAHVRRFVRELERAGLTA